MKDIGLGVLDPYTVVIVLITLVAVHVLFGYPIPLDTSNATQLLVSLVVFTGYIYAARSLLRLPVAIIRAVISRGELADYFRWLNPLMIRGNGLLFWLRMVLETIVQLPVFLLYVLFLVADFSEDRYINASSSPKLRLVERKIWLGMVLKLFDRASVILFVFLATLPRTQPYVTILGLLGIVVMLLVYLFKGNFSALIEDELVKRSQKQLTDTANVETQPAQSPEENRQVVRWGSIPVKSSACAVCSRICTEDGNGRVPKVCSLECFQKWTAQWEKDWCIGDGAERELLLVLRQDGYQSLQKIETSISRLVALDSAQALWALMAVVRDCSGRIETDAMTLQEAVRDASEGIAYFAQNKRYAADVLNACIFDLSPDVIWMAAEMISKHIAGRDVRDLHVEELLHAEDIRVRVSAIKVLGKAHNTTALLKQLGKGEDVPMEDRNILEAFSRMEQDIAIRALQRAQAHKVFWIREEATEMLRNKFALECDPPNFAEDTIACIRCGYSFSIHIPRDKDTLVALPTLRRRFLPKSERRFIKCDSCKKPLVVLFTRPMQYKRRLIAQQGINEREAPFLTEISPIDRGVYNT